MSCSSTHISRLEYPSVLFWFGGVVSLFAICSWTDLKNPPHRSLHHSVSGCCSWPHWWLVKYPPTQGARTSPSLLGVYFGHQVSPGHASIWLSWPMPRMSTPEWCVWWPCYVLQKWGWKKQPPQQPQGCSLRYGCGCRPWPCERGAIPPSRQRSSPSSAQRVGFFNIGSGRVGYWTKYRVAGRVRVG